MIYFFLYLFTLRHLVWIRGPSHGSNPVLTVSIIEDWAAKVWKATAPFVFEPVASITVGGHLLVLLSIPNLLIGLLLSTLVGANVAIAVAHFRGRKVCRPSGLGLLGALPGLLGGFACCVPTAAVLLGANSVLALIALQGYLVPISALALGVALLWGASRLGAEVQ